MYDAYVAYHARMRPRALAVVTPSRLATYAEFDADVNRYAAGLQALGVGPERGVVTLETQQKYRQLVMLMALARLGVASGVTSDRQADLRISDRSGESDDRILRLSRAWISQVEQAPPVEVPSAPRDPDGLARVLLSSGTTKTARRVPTSWRRRMEGHITALGAYASGRLGVWAIRTGIDSGMGNALSLLAWTVGAAVADGFVSADLPALMERHPEGLLALTPIQLREVLLALPPGYEQKPGWRVVVAGAAMPAALARAARSRLTPDIIIAYGAAEAGRACVGPASLLETHPGAIGWPVPEVVVEVVGPDGQVLPTGEQGEIRVRSSQISQGYLDNPQAASATFRDGYVYPGDLGRRLANGSFVIDGRLDEQMNIQGVKFLPDELENALADHPQVRDCAAFALPGPDAGDECWMAVVADGEVSRESLLEQIRRSGLHPPPIRFAWSQEIPRSEMGKIDRRGLRDQTAAALAKGG